MNHHNKKQLLDPIGTMCHIVSLAFKPLNTKIGINNHAVIIQESNYFQFIDRYWNGDNRENISLLYNIVIRIIEWYIVPLSQKYTQNKDIEINPQTKSPIVDSRGETKLAGVYAIGNLVLPIKSADQCAVQARTLFS